MQNPLRSLLLVSSALFAGCSVEAEVSSPSAATAVKTQAPAIELLQPKAPPPHLRNPWPEEWESEFQERAKKAIGFFAGKNYGGTYFENEKRAYANAMMDFMAGNRKKAVDFLQAEDANAKEWNRHTLGIDYFPCFTIKHQMRKYFLYGEFLDAAYKKRMFEAAKLWTEKDPLWRPHPDFKGPSQTENWTPFAKNSWVDIRSTDNLRFMRDTSVYLMAEETSNEETRKIYRQKLIDHARAMFTIGMGEWDSENYLSHSLAPWLNVYDFAKDEEMRLLAKGALDWVTMAAALKYYRGAMNGPNKRDYYHPVPLEAAANLFAQYFGDFSLPLETAEPDYVHVITSHYRPPQAVVALARKNFTRPVELFISHPVYEHWKPGAADKPESFETQYIGNTFLLGSLPTGNVGGIWDVNGLKMLVANSKRGADFFIPASGDKPTKITTSTNNKDQVAQYGSLLLHLNADGAAPFHFFTPPDAKFEQINGVWFWELEKTWLAIRPINLQWLGENTQATPEVRKRAPGATIHSAKGNGERLCGYAMEVGEAPMFSDYQQFKRDVLQKSKLDLSALATSIATFTGANGRELRMQVAEKGLPQIWRDGKLHDWNTHFAPYQAAQGVAPVQQAWKSGALRVQAGGKIFEAKLSDDGKYSFSEK